MLLILFVSGFSLLSLSKNRDRVLFQGERELQNENNPSEMIDARQLISRLNQDSASLGNSLDTLAKEKGNCIENLILVLKYDDRTSTLAQFSHENFLSCLIDLIYYAEWIDAHKRH